MILAIAYILGMGLLNGVRGSGIFSFINRPMFMMLFTGLTGVVIYPHLWLCIPLFVAFWASFVCGWGKYMNAAFPSIIYISESEVKPIDWVCNKLLGTSVTASQFSTWCTLAMSLRGLMFSPIFIVLSYLNHYVIVYVTGMVLMGPIYWARRIFPAAISIRCAEITTGILLGSLIWFSIAP